MHNLRILFALSILIAQSRSNNKGERFLTILKDKKLSNSKGYIRYGLDEEKCLIECISKV